MSCVNAWLILIIRVHNDYLNNNFLLPCSCELDICTVALLEVVLIRPRAAFSFPILISNYPVLQGAGRACVISHIVTLSVYGYW